MFFTKIEGNSVPMPPINRYNNLDPTRPVKNFGINMFFDVKANEAPEADNSNQTSNIQQPQAPVGQLQNPQQPNPYYPQQSQVVQHQPPQQPGVAPYQPPMQQPGQVPIIPPQQQAQRVPPPEEINVALNSADPNIQSRAINDALDMVKTMAATLPNQNDKNIATLTSDNKIATSLWENIIDKGPSNDPVQEKNRELAASTILEMIKNSKQYVDKTQNRPVPLRELDQYNDGKTTILATLSELLKNPTPAIKKEAYDCLNQLVATPEDQVVAQDIISRAQQ